MKLRVSLMCSESDPLDCAVTVGGVTLTRWAGQADFDAAALAGPGAGSAAPAPAPRKRAAKKAAAVVPAQANAGGGTDGTG